jgi:DNA-binding XRE family transcriptional regulator
VRSNLFRFPSISYGTFITTAALREMTRGLVTIPVFRTTLAMMCRHVDLRSSREYISIEINYNRRDKHVTGRLCHRLEGCGGRLRELRGFDLTQAEFARRIGVSQGFLSYAERGEKEVGPQILLRISREFEKTLEWLLTGNEPA